jgi:hypothetical protein
MQIIIQVFLIGSGSIPLLMVIFGGVEGAYDTFIKNYKDNGIVWILVLAFFFIGVFWSWRDFKKGKWE